MLTDITKVLHLQDGSTTKCGKSIVGMSSFAKWDLICEKCWGPNADMETVAKKVGVTVQPKQQPK